MTTTYLLDINLLLALSDPMHVHHEVAHRWYADGGDQSWATCPITENGFVRIASHPKYPNSPGSATVALNTLRRFCSRSGHCFWSEGITLRESLTVQSVITHNQVTDIYLLALTVHHGGKLATLDQNIPAARVRGGENAMKILYP